MWGGRGVEVVGSLVSFRVDGFGRRDVCRRGRGGREAQYLVDGHLPDDEGRDENDHRQEIAENSARRVLPEKNLRPEALLQAEGDEAQGDGDERLLLELDDQAYRRQSQAVKQSHPGRRSKCRCRCRCRC